MTDHDLTRLLERAADTAPTPDSRLVEAGVRRGTARRRRRLAATVAGGAAAVVAVTAVVAVATGGPAQTPGPAPAGPPVASDPAPSSTPAPPEPTRTAPEEKWTPPPRGTRPDVEVFGDVVGEAVDGVGVLSDVYSYAYGYGGIRSVHATLTDDVGPAHVNVAVTTEDPTTTGAVRLVCDRKRIRTLEDCEPVGPPNEGLSCDDGTFLDWQCRQLADGTVVRWGKDRTYTDERDQGEYSNSVVVHHPDGLLVNAYVFNGAGEKLGVGRATPPLGFDTMRAIALDPRWSDVDLED